MLFQPAEPKGLEKAAKHMWDACLALFFQSQGNTRPLLAYFSQTFQEGRNFGTQLCLTAFSESFLFKLSLMTVVILL